MLFYNWKDALGRAQSMNAMNDGWCVMPIDRRRMAHDAVLATACWMALAAIF